MSTSTSSLSSVAALQAALRLSLRARTAFLRGRELLGGGAEEAQEQFLAAWDHAREAGVLCGRHDLLVPFALTRIPRLLAAFEDGEAEGAQEREEALDGRVDRDCERYDAAA